MIYTYVLQKKIHIYFFTFMIDIILLSLVLFYNWTKEQAFNLRP